MASSDKLGFKRDNTTGALIVQSLVDSTSGQLGVYAPSFYTGHSNLALTANRGFFGRFIAPRDMTITIIAFEVAVAASVDDACDVALYDSTLATKLVSKGATSGLLNSLGVKEPTVAATALTGGSVYYAFLSCGAIGGTAASLRSTISSTNNTSGDLMGTANGKREMAFRNASHPAAAGPLVVTSGGQCPILAVRES